MDLEATGSDPLAAVCLVPPSFMSDHAQLLTFCFKQDCSMITYNTKISVIN